jgi:hypothetical protein
MAAYVLTESEALNELPSKITKQPNIKRPS